MPLATRPACHSSRPPTQPFSVNVAVTISCKIFSCIKKCRITTEFLRLRHGLFHNHSHSVQLWNEWRCYRLSCFCSIIPKKKHLVQKELSAWFNDGSDWTRTNDQGIICQSIRSQDTRPFIKRQIWCYQGGSILVAPAKHLERQHSFFVCSLFKALSVISL